MTKKLIATRKFIKRLQKYYVVIKNCNVRLSILMQDAIWCLDINCDKILLDTLKPKESYHNYIMVVHIQHVVQILDISYLPQSNFIQTNVSNPASS